MKESDQYHKWVEWSEEDQTYIGKCPDLITGIHGDEQTEIIHLLDQYILLIIDKSIADLAANLRRKFGWKLPDAFQAALAQYHKVKLSTRNTKDFKPQIHDFVEIPYAL